eukprot:gene23738-30785_t
MSTMPSKFTKALTHSHQFRTGIDSEIEVALKLYKGNELEMTKTYWPKAFRVLMYYILEWMNTHFTDFQHLQSFAEFADNAKLEKLLSDLSKPTSQYIPVSKMIGLPAKLPPWSDSAGDSWPIDIEDRNDLLIVPKDVYWKISHKGAFLNQQSNSPIVIEVSVSHAEGVKREITTLSDSLLNSGCENYLPINVAEVIAVAREYAFQKREEGLTTTGNTAGHVHSIGDYFFDSQCVNSTRQLLVFSGSDDLELGAAFYKFASVGSHHFNVLPLKLMTTDEVNCEIGEEVYKLGRSTGLTIADLQASNVYVNNHILRNWVSKESRFAFSEDCGSLYCVKRGSWFVPIAIHRYSFYNEVSFGCLFTQALEFFPEDVETITFRNANHFL